MVFFSYFLNACTQEDSNQSNYKSLAQYDEHIKQQQKKELMNLSKVEQCDFSNIILVQLFDGYIPIPNTYYFSNRRSQDWINEFSRQSDYGVYSGQILLGYYEKFKSSPSASINLKIMQNYENISKRGELEIIHRKLKDIYNTNSMIIHNEHEFMIVQDHNKGLWQAMLDGYDFLKEGGCGLVRRKETN